ncbi:DUF1461 domain-containing protein [Thiothrix sp.]|uniref:lipoprotein intramolecular transacylase Lit n=1 Tax=Thiothrix sp. TaxID=1032 RepID=UPI002580D636|nr:DUF1461 domain-containing protein [Thiothrix sp.]
MTAFSKYYLFFVSIAIAATLMLIVFHGLLYWYQPVPKSELAVLHDWVWHYFLVEPMPVLPNTDLLDMRSRRHLLDVKIILNNLWGTLLISILVSLFLLVRFRHELKKLTKHVFYVNILIFSGFVILVFLDFRSAFVEVHYLLFPVNSWFFAQDSLLIQLFPLGYFQQFFYLWFAGCITLSLCLFMLSCRWPDFHEKSPHANRNP